MLICLNAPYISKVQFQFNPYEGFNGTSLKKNSEKHSLGGGVLVVGEICQETWRS